MAVCRHLAPLERELRAAGIAETFRGRPWSANCREWVYFDAELDLADLRRRHGLPDFVADHVHVGTVDGAEKGFVCRRCHDAVMGHFRPA